MKKKISFFFSRNFPSAWKFWMQLKKKIFFKGKSSSEIFNHIYKTNMWGNKESVSGEGSTISATQNLLEELPALIKELKIASVTDIPCGDFNWMKRIVPHFEKYYGGDIVEELILMNQKKYATEKISFHKINLLTDPLPAGDLLLVRDCLVHLSYYDIHIALENILRSDITWLLTTHFPECKNMDASTGSWRPLNLCDPPFSFPIPIQFIHDGGSDKKKTLALWKIDSLKKIKTV